MFCNLSQTHGGIDARTPLLNTVGQLVICVQLAPNRQLRSDTRPVRPVPVQHIAENPGATDGRGQGEMRQMRATIALPLSYRRRPT